jgi:hypothetical protein
MKKTGVTRGRGYFCWLCIHCNDVAQYVLKDKETGECTPICKDCLMEKWFDEDKYDLCETINDI